MQWIKKIFSGEQTQLLTDFSQVGTDIHSHLIPSVDDGANSLEVSVEMIRGLAALGYKRLIATPHVMNDYYKNTGESIRKGLEILREAVLLEKIPVEMDAAAEYFLDFNIFTLIDTDDLLTIDNKYVLFELSYFNPPTLLNDAVFRLQTGGYKPILAHPERYIYYHRDFSKYEELKTREVFFQLNINSLTGEYSAPVKKIAERLINENMIEFLGTDAHTVHHVSLLKEALRNKHLSKLISDGKILNRLL